MVSTNDAEIDMVYQIILRQFRDFQYFRIGILDSDKVLQIAFEVAEEYLIIPR